MAAQNTMQDVGQEAVQSTHVATRDRFLRRVLVGNAIFSALTALLLIFNASAVARFLGIAPAWALMLLGILLLPFAAGVFMASRRAAVDPREVRAIFALDVAWVVGSILLLAIGGLPFTPAGKWAVAIVADIVAVFAMLEWLGLRRMQKTA